MTLISTILTVKRLTSYFIGSNISSEDVLFQTEPGPVLEGQSDVSLLAVTSCLFMGDVVNDQSPHQQDSESAESGGVSTWL